ncbi:MAG: hypothetical protein LBR21_10765 [Propionibacteriaceae bacterium]|jgi:hypothetical protein|nr:hypothetical protein [Propionibacteriaceae bacterium]
MSENQNVNVSRRKLLVGALGIVVAGGMATSPKARAVGKEGSSGELSLEEWLLRTVKA